jgi:Tfp pilus assembly major pilin PilA
MDTRIVLIYVIAGLLFAAGAVYLQATRSLTLEGLKGNESALKIEFDKFSVQTFAPIVGLYVIALICAVGIPAYQEYTTSKNPVDDSPVKTSIHIRPRTALNLSVPEARVDTIYPLPLMVYKSHAPLEYSLGSDQYKPVTLQLSYDRKENVVVVVMESSGARTVKRIQALDNAASLDDDIVLEPADVAPKPYVRAALPSSPTGGKYTMIAPPPVVQAQSAR